MTAIAPLSPMAAGLGLRRALMGPLQSAAPGEFDFLECAPDNWIGVGGRFGEGELNGGLDAAYNRRQEVGQATAARSGAGRKVRAS